MAVEKDNLDTEKLTTIGVVGALLTAAISYLAAGMYHERVGEIHTARQQAPALEKAAAEKDRQQAEAAGVEDAIREVAGEER